MHLLKHYVVFTEYNCFAYGSLKQKLSLSQSTLLWCCYLSSFREGLTKRQVVGQREPTTKNSRDLCSYFTLRRPEVCGHFCIIIHVEPSSQKHLILSSIQ